MNETLQLFWAEGDYRIYRNEGNPECDEFQLWHRKNLVIAGLYETVSKYYIAEFL